MFSIASRCVNKAVPGLIFYSSRNESFYRLITYSCFLGKSIFGVQPFQFKMLLIENRVSKIIVLNDFSIIFLLELLLIRQVLSYSLILGSICIAIDVHSGFIV